MIYSYNKILINKYLDLDYYANPCRVNYCNDAIKYFNIKFDKLFLI
jgi:hypothetical protein